MLSEIKTISPDGIRSIEGFIGDRFKVNMELDNPEEMELLLLPFANQGVVRGPYRIFMDYERP